MAVTNKISTTPISNRVSELKVELSNAAIIRDKKIAAANITKNAVLKAQAQTEYANKYSTINAQLAELQKELPKAITAKESGNRLADSYRRDSVSYQADKIALSNKLTSDRMTEMSNWIRDAEVVSRNLASIYSGLSRSASSVKQSYKNESDYWATQAIAYQKKKEELSIAIQRVIEADKAANSAKDPILGSADTLNPDSRGGEMTEGGGEMTEGGGVRFPEEASPYEQQGSAGFTPNTTYLVIGAVALVGIGIAVKIFKSRK